MNCPELTTLQKVAGFVNLMDILQIGALLLAAFCACYLIFRFFGYLILQSIPVEVWEAIGYLVAVALIVSGVHVPEVWRLWVTLGGTLLLSGMILVTAQLHRLEPNPTSFFFTLTLLWGGVALFYNSQVHGFFAVAALMGALGAGGYVIPGFGYVLGFKDDSALERATVIAFTVLFAALALQHGAKVTTVFTAGAVWLGSFVGFLGLLIASSKWYSNRRHYAVMQVITILAGIAALALGSVLDVGPLRGIGGTFFVLYLIEKPFEIPTHSKVTYAFIGLAVAACVGAGVMWAQAHMDLVQPYLLF